MSDLRDSGNIEEFADVVMFLYREDYYFPDKAKENGTEGYTEVIFAKQRKADGQLPHPFLKRNSPSSLRSITMTDEPRDALFEEMERVKIRFVAAYEKLLGRAITEEDFEDILDALDRIDELSDEELERRLARFKKIAPLNEPT